MNRSKYLHCLSEIVYLSNSRITSELSFLHGKGAAHSHSLTHMHACTHTHTYIHTRTSPFYSYVNNVCVAGEYRGASQLCMQGIYVRCLQKDRLVIIYLYIYIYAHLRYWQNLVKSMGRSLQVQILNYLSILSLESSMDAQND